MNTDTGNEAGNGADELVHAAHESLDLSAVLCLVGWIGEARIGIYESSPSGETSPAGASKSRGTTPSIALSVFRVAFPRFFSTSRAVLGGISASRAYSSALQPLAFA
ncbi:hypothetical protein J2847_005830 [Azospirillum agricola]|uniref:hypothetical protein n=1 Tax=Azospirillum agricola TaxID=1720247 RepID=UPI001AEB1576|nr:hypothetical protein [Azospirillum agricola]MBP2232501.1 hypothetical protein [Azospirillum agricola]